MVKNDEIILDITDISSDGSGIGRYNGMAVFVPLTAVGDKVKVHILKVKKTYAYAKLISVITASNSRIDNDCAVFARCGGCVYRHIDYDAECELKQNQVENAIKRIGGIDLNSNPIIKGVTHYGYRNKAQYPISQNGEVGFFAKHSHRIIECENCLLQPDEFSKICKTVSSWIKQNNISVYDEMTNSGLLRHLYIRKGYKTGEIMVVLVINGNTVPLIDELTKRLILDCSNIVSIQLNFNTKKTNVILGEKCKVVYGKPFITDEICGVRVRISPLSFYQVNPQMMERLYLKAAELANAKDKTVLDLYCGAGTIGLSLAKIAKQIIGVEIVEPAVLDARQNAKDNHIDNARYICADAAKAASELTKQGIKADVVILDPPRKGCEEALLSCVANDFAPERIVYVSCDPATLARDCAILTKLGYELREYTPVDMFPRTAHVESVVCLTRTFNNELRERMN